MKIILFQFRTDISAEHERSCVFNYLGMEQRFHRVVNVFQIGNYREILENPHHLLDGIDKVIIGGCGEFNITNQANSAKTLDFHSRLKSFEKVLGYIIDNDIPTLGMCFGHQLIARYLGVDIVNEQSQKETGVIEVSLSEDREGDQLFKDMPDKFYVVVGHEDSLSSLPKDSVLLASSRKHKFHAFRHKTNIYGVQFHPELNKDDLMYRLKLYPKYSKNTDESFDQFHETTEAVNVLKNFVQIQ